MGWGVVTIVTRVLVCHSHTKSHTRHAHSVSRSGERVFSRWPSGEHWHRLEKSRRSPPPTSPQVLHPAELPPLSITLPLLVLLSSIHFSSPLGVLSPLRTTNPKKNGTPSSSCRERERQRDSHTQNSICINFYISSICSVNPFDKIDIDRLSL